MTQPARRFTAHSTLRPDLVRGLAADHPAVTGARTLFPSTVIAPTDSPRLLISGINQRKIGSHVTKGPWAGMPIYCLTLEERATCPSTCHNWRSCYGNGMPLSRRHAHGPELEFLLDAELAEKQSAHPAGFVLRLHILGDFYDLAYTALWSRFLAKYPALHAFGFTARSETSDEGIIIRMLNRDYPDRWVIRFSRPERGAVRGARYATVTRTIPSRPTLPDGSIICPAQTGRTSCCGTCALCWHSPKPITFIAHSHLGTIPGTIRGPRRPSPSIDDTDSDLDTPDLAERKTAANRNADSATFSDTTQTLAISPYRERSETPFRHGERGEAASEATQNQTVELPNPRQAHPEPGTAEPHPLRPIELRAWLQHRNHPIPPGLNNAELLAFANTVAATAGLPPFRLITSRPADEIITTHHRLTKELA